MPHRPNSLDTALLLIELLRRIPRQRLVTAPEFDAQLQEAGYTRSLRTIQRLLDSASAHPGFGLERQDASKPYGYRWRADAQGLTLSTLSAHEALLLRLAHAQLKPLLPAPLLQSLEGFCTQALRRDDNRPGGEELARQWPHKVRMVSATQPLLPPTLAEGVLEAVSEALYANRWLDADYENITGQRKARSLMPLGLVQQAERLYLVARELKYAYSMPPHTARLYALHRMHSAHASTLTFERPEFDLARYEAEGQLAYGNGQRIRLHFCINTQESQYLKETRLSADQHMQPIEGGWRISATVMQSLLLDRWLNSFGKAIWDVQREMLPQ